MTSEKRPVALTVLAIAAFLLSFSAAIAAIDLILVSHPPGSSPGSGELIWVYPSGGVQLGLGLVGLLRVALQILAGVGFLRQSERWGRRVANLWGGAVLVQSALTYVLFQIQPTLAYLMVLLVTLAAVAVTLTLVNRTYRGAFR